MDRIIVSRHPAAIEFIARELDGEIVERTLSGKTGKYIKIRATPESDPQHKCDHHLWSILASATPDDVRGKIVYGNLPLHLAALAAELHVIEFADTAPLGAEYTLAEMDAAGARLTRYRVSTD